MRLAGPLQIGAAMAVWSSWGLAVRWLPLPAWALTGYVGLAAAAAAATLWIGCGGAAAALWPRRYRLPLVLMGLLFLANSVCFLTAYERTTVANAVLTHYTAPVFVALIAPLALGERVLPVTPVSLLLAGAGMGLLLPGIHWSWEDRHLQGLLLGTASGLAYAVLIVMARALCLRVAALPLLFVQNGVVALVLLPGLLLLGLPREPVVLGALALLGVVHATGAALLYLAGLRRVRAQTAAILGYLEPLLAVGLAALVLGERVAPHSLLGGGLILASGALVVWAEGQGPKGVDAPAAPR